jgi:hypothetical protein
MELASLTSALGSFVANWPFWIVFTASLLSVIQPRWFWDGSENADLSRDGSKQEPSPTWLFSTRVAGVVFMVMVVVALCYGQPGQ